MWVSTKDGNTMEHYKMTCSSRMLSFVTTLSLSQRWGIESTTELQPRGVPLPGQQVDPMVFQGCSNWCWTNDIATPQVVINGNSTVCECVILNHSTICYLYIHDILPFTPCYHPQKMGSQRSNPLLMHTSTPLISGPVGESKRVSHLDCIFWSFHKLVGGLVAINFIFPSIGFLSSSQLTFIFFRGVAQPPTSKWGTPKTDGF